MGLAERIREAGWPAAGLLLALLASSRAAWGGEGQSAAVSPPAVGNSVGAVNLMPSAAALEDNPVGVANSSVALKSLELVSKAVANSVPTNTTTAAAMQNPTAATLATQVVVAPGPLRIKVVKRYHNHQMLNNFGGGPLSYTANGQPQPLLGSGHIVRMLLQRRPDLSKGMIPTAAVTAGGGDYQDNEPDLSRGVIPAAAFTAGGGDYQDHDPALSVVKTSSDGHLASVRDPLSSTTVAAPLVAPGWLSETAPSAQQQQQLPYKPSVMGGPPLGSQNMLIAMASAAAPLPPGQTPAGWSSSVPPVYGLTNQKQDTGFTLVESILKQTTTAGPDQRTNVAETTATTIVTPTTSRSTASTKATTAVKTNPTVESTLTTIANATTSGTCTGTKSYATTTMTKASTTPTAVMTFLPAEMSTVRRTTKTTTTMASVPSNTFGRQEIVVETTTAGSPAATTTETAVTGNSQPTTAPGARPPVCKPCGQAKLNSNMDYSSDPVTTTEAEYVYKDYDPKKLEKKGQRIVGGMSVADDHTRPWHAHIELGGNSWCGGALINHKYVLTAAHCFCANRNLPPVGERRCVRGANNIDVAYNISQLPGVVFGTTSLYGIDTKSGRHVIARAVVHPGFDLDKLMGPFDIALLELQHPVEITRLEKEHPIMPICLPKNETEKISRGSVAGYGLLFGNQLTSVNGPDKNKPCVGSCQQTSSPAVWNPVCQDFNKFLVGENPWLTQKRSSMLEVTLELQNGTSIPCFPARSPNGWCETSKTKPTYDKNWGVCEGNDAQVTEVLQETKLHVFDSEECKKRAAEQGIPTFNPEVEFCAAYKYKTSVKLTYSVSEKDNTFSFLLKKNLTRELADMVGGRDTCEGDSGNALFEFKDPKASIGVATIYGLVSRGMVTCGMAAAPGIYTNVAKFLGWIYENSKSGACTGDDLSKAPPPSKKKKSESEESDESY